MAQFFINVSRDWLVAPLDRPGYALGGGDALLRPTDPAAPPPRAAAIVCRSSDAARWALLPWPSARVRVNGKRLAAGLHILRDKDEVRVGDARLFFSAERLALAEPFPDPGRPAVCGRCRLRLEVAAPAVRCPRCGTWCHSTPERPCWNYSPACPCCDQRTDAETFTWTPADL